MHMTTNTAPATEDLYAVKFRHANGTIHETSVWARSETALVNQVEGEGRAEIITSALIQLGD